MTNSGQDTTTADIFALLPDNPSEYMNFSWDEFERFYEALVESEIDQANIDQWLHNWTAVSSRVSEIYCRLVVETRSNTSDKAIKSRFTTFLNEIFTPAQQCDQKLRLKLLESGLTPDRFDQPLKVMRTEAELYREENLKLFTEEKNLQTEYDNIVGSQTVHWQGEEKTLTQLEPLSLSSDREERERAWRLGMERQIEDRAAINELWKRNLAIRMQIAKNADYSDYTAFRWDQLSRFDYTPQNCAQFRESIEQVVVPAATRILQKRREKLNVDTLRPWDLNVDVHNRPPLAPFQTGRELAERSSAIFHKVDPRLGEYFDIMVDEELLDLENRKGKGPGGFCITYQASKRPFIFMNAVGLQGNVRTMIHEAGHAFHAFEKVKLPYIQQRMVGSEFNEVASMAMELLCSPYLTHEHGGFYSEADAARARVQHLENIILFWPYMAVVDGFQHWVYANAEEAMDPANCDRAWDELWQRFMPVVDWSGLETERTTGWHRKMHIFHVPFYYVEYGLAQLGAVQIWDNALKDQQSALTKYLDALALGSTVSLPELYKAAGARFAFDAQTLQRAVSLIESVIAQLESN